MTQDHELREVQQQLQAAIIHPTQPEPSMTAVLNRLIVSSEAVDAQARIAIYRRSYFARLQQCMAAQFPVLCKTLSEAIFYQFTAQYLAAHPPSSYTLADLGAGFAGYLACERPDDGTESWIDFMLELTRFEWRMGVIFDEPDEAPQNLFCDIEGTGPVYRLAGNLHLLAFRYPTYPYFCACIQKEEEPEIPQRQDNYCIITRQHYILKYLPLTSIQYDYLQYLFASTNIDTAQRQVHAKYKYNEGLSSQQFTHWHKYWQEMTILSSI